jgi:hypothetical protein
MTGVSVCVCIAVGNDVIIHGSLDVHFMCCLRQPPPQLSRGLLLVDILIVIVVSISVFKAFLSYCKNVGLPFTWVMELSGDTYHGEVLEIEKISKILFADVAETHSVPHGYGVYTFACGTEYDGGWKEGKMCGVHGKLTYIEGHYYDGEWLDGKPNGHGTYTWYGGAVFMGEFKNGFPDGQVLFFASPLTQAHRLDACAPILVCSLSCICVVACNVSCM